MKILSTILLVLCVASCGLLIIGLPFMLRSFFFGRERTEEWLERWNERMDCDFKFDTIDWTLVIAIFVALITYAIRYLIT